MIEDLPATIPAGRTDQVSRTRPRAIDKSYRPDLLNPQNPPDRTCARDMGAKEGKHPWPGPPLLSSRSALGSKSTAICRPSSKSKTSLSQIGKPPGFSEVTVAVRDVPQSLRDSRGIGLGARKDIPRRFVEDIELAALTGGVTWRRPI